MSKYEYLGLAIFVAIPLPGTGAWTGALAAAFFGYAAASGPTIGDCRSTGGRYGGQHSHLWCDQFIVEGKDCSQWQK